MRNKTWLKNYAKFFKNRLSENLKPGITITANLFPVEKEGAVIEFILGKEKEEEYKFMPTRSSINDVIKGISQNLVTGDISNIKFAGTNISLEGNRIIVIKGEDNSSSWDGQGAKEDYVKIMGLSRVRGAHD